MTGPNIVAKIYVLCLLALFLLFNFLLERHLGTHVQQLCLSQILIDVNTS